MKFDYSALRAEILFQYGTVLNFSKEIGISSVALYNKLANKRSFTTEEIVKIMDKLKLPKNTISDFFFTVV